MALKFNVRFIPLRQFCLHTKRFELDLRTFLNQILFASFSKKAVIFLKNLLVTYYLYTLFQLPKELILMKLNKQFMKRFIKFCTYHSDIYLKTFQVLVTLIYHVLSSYCKIRKTLKKFEATCNIGT